MFVSISSSQSSLWGWSSKSLALTGQGLGTSSTFTNYTYSPVDGRLYALASNPGTQPYLMVLDPKDANSGSTNNTLASGTLVTQNGSTRPNFSGTTAYCSAGILAQDGKIYFIPQIGYDVCIVTPNAIDDSISWSFFNISAGYGTTTTYLAGAILGKDGKIYILSQAVTGNGSNYLNRLDISGGTPVIEPSYYNGSTSARSLSAGVGALGTLTGKTNPGSNGCFNTNQDPITASNQRLTDASAATNRSGVDRMALDPLSDKIYATCMLGTWIFYIDPANWLNSNCIGSTEGLWLRTLKPGYQGYRTANSVIGCANNPYKFAGIVPGKNKKLYVIVSNAVFTMAGVSGSYVIPSDLQYHVELDTVTNTTKMIGDTSLNSGYCFSGAGLLPNGVIFGIPSFSSPTTFPYSKTFEINTDATVEADKVRLDSKSVIYIRTTAADSFVCNATPSFSTTFNYLGPNFKTIPTATKKGKFIISGRNRTYGMEVLSVKNFYPGVTNFDSLQTYDPDTNLNLLEPPSDLANLPTSDYNVFCNRPG